MCNFIAQIFAALTLTHKNKFKKKLLVTKMTATLKLEANEVGCGSNLKPGLTLVTFAHVSRDTTTS